MRVFVAGASGALGSRLVPQLIDAGHDVIGSHNSPANAELLRALGAKPVLLDLLDADAVREAVLESEPEGIVHQATALANVKFGRNFDKVFARTNELRTTGTDALLAAARERPGYVDSSRRVSPPTATRGRRDRSKPRRIGSIRTRRRTPGRAPARWPISSGWSPTSAGSCFAMAASTEPPTMR
jgi:nucleoside-diphosphate-sugar epimerase